MFTYTNWLVHLEHHKDLLREAEQERLAQIAASAKAEKLENKTKVQKIAPRVEALCCNPVSITCCAA